MHRNPVRTPWILLFVGIVLLAATHMRWGVGVLAWFAPLPWLRFLRTTRGWKSRLAFLIAQFLAWTLAISKIVTEPLPMAAAIGFALPMTFFLSAPYLVWDGLRRRLGDGWLSVGAFGAATALGEWGQHVATPFASWGAVAYSQVENLPLLQLASLTGIAGLAFLIHTTAASLEAALSRGATAMRGPLTAVISAVLVVMVFGSLRLSLTTGPGEQTVRVAAVGTDLELTGQGALPPREELARILDGLFTRTRQAASAGARLVVWTEAAALVYPDQEDRFVSEVAALGGGLGIELVAGYVVPLQIDPMRYENKYVWIRPDGTVDHTYFKHHPVVGEPAVPGTGPLPRVDAAWGRLSGAICYDYDFPRLGLEHAAADVDLVALPSSDWRGIDPIHTQMAAVRAIEGGHSVVRSTRWGLSAGIDPTGRLRGWMSHFDGPRRVLVTELPVRKVWTLYGFLGDWFVAVSAALLFVGLGLACYARRHGNHGLERGESGASGCLPQPGPGRGRHLDRGRSLA